MSFTVTSDQLKEQLALIFEAWDFAPDDVPSIVELMVESDLRGIDSHGVGKIKLYEKHLKEKRLNPRPQPRLAEDYPTLALLDGDNGMGHLSMRRGMEIAMEKARMYGVGAVAIRHSYHIGATGIYSCQAAEEGLIGFALTGATQPSAVPTFGREARLATNPLAFAAPCADAPPMSLDMATTTVAVGKVDIARWLGKPIPTGWALGETGEPETDPDKVLAVTPKRMTALGGTREGGSHKGYGLATMIEILTSILSDSSIGGRLISTWQPGPFVDVGHFVLALDPDMFDEEEGGFARRMSTWMHELRTTPPADPGQPVLIPGDPEHAARAQRETAGIPISAALLEEVRDVAGTAGAAYILPDASAKVH